MIVVVLGLPGSGKSYFAVRLASRIGATYLSSDRIRQTMHRAGQYSLQDKMVVYQEMVRLTEGEIGERKIVVVDGTFYKQAMVQLFEDVAGKLSVPVHIIEVMADESLIHERLSKPRMYSEADFDVYKKVKAESEVLTNPHLQLQSTDDNITDMIDKAVQYLSHERT